MSVLASTEIRRERMAICRKCDHLKGLTRCDLCGCVMTAKTWLANEQCPINKWFPIIEHKNDA